MDVRWQGPVGPGPARVRPGLLALALTSGLVLALGATTLALLSAAPGDAAGGHPAHAAHVVPHQDPLPTSDHLMVGGATDPATGGYWTATADGGVFAFGAPFYGSAGALALTAPVVGMAATFDGRGYWLVAADGGVFTYGDAAYLGSAAGLPLRAPIVGMAAAADGGYWLVAADGGVFNYGAPFDGSAGGLALRAPIVGMAATPGGSGYWLAAADGGVFNYGDALFDGSAGGLALTAPVVGMAATAGGSGYWLAAADGGVFSYGHAVFYGSASGLLARSATGLAPSSTGAGYRLLSVGGAVYGFGDAPYLGSVAVAPLAGLTVAVDPGHDGGNGSDPSFIGRPIDGGGFTEPCDTVGTETAGGYTEHAFNFDVATRLEARLQGEGATVVMTRTTDSGVGPCVNERAAIGNDAHAAAAVSIHADGGPVGGRGFDVIEPAPVVSSISNNTAIVPASARLAVDVRDAFATDTGEQPSDYSGQGGIDQRGDLGGLTLSTVPKVLIECANMQNPADAALTESAAWRQQAAQGLADGLSAFLVAEERP